MKNPNKSHNRMTALPEWAAKELGKLHDEYTVIYDKEYPNDDGDYFQGFNDYEEANVSRRLKRYLKKRMKQSEEMHRVVDE